MIDGSALNDSISSCGRQTLFCCHFIQEEKISPASFFLPRAGKKGKKRAERMMSRFFVAFGALWFSVVSPSLSLSSLNVRATTDNVCFCRQRGAMPWDKQIVLEVSPSPSPFSLTQQTHSTIYSFPLSRLPATSVSAVGLPYRALSKEQTYGDIAIKRTSVPV